MCAQIGKNTKQGGRYGEGDGKKHSTDFQCLFCVEVGHAYLIPVVDILVFSPVVVHGAELKNRQIMFTICTCMVLYVTILVREGTNLWCCATSY